MSAAYDVPCLFCGAPHGFDVIPGEPAVSYYRDGSGYPGSGPQVDWRSAGCECSQSPAANEGKYWELMTDVALEEARRA